MGEDFSFEHTGQVRIPKRIFDQIIGQPEAVRIAKLCAMQRRHLLLVGPPGTGKSMVAHAISSLFTKPTCEVSVLHNPSQPERPFVEVRPREEVERQRKEKKELGKIVKVEDVPAFVSERLGYRCRRCGKISDPDSSACPSCGADKFRRQTGPFDDLLSAMGSPMREDAVHTTRLSGKREELVVFERAGKGNLRMLDGRELEKMSQKQSSPKRNIILPLDRPTFVQATGASETELLGDVRHDPYGSHPQIGSLPYTRVVGGAIHEAHEGVLFIDELLSIGKLQRHIFTAMQEGKFPITGRNPSSTGAAVRVDSVPCEFVLVASCNINDIGAILPPLRNRIAGNGYELLINTVMPDNEKNRLSLAQFVAQEITRDGRIPHATPSAVEEIIIEAKRRAWEIDKASGLTLRLRSLSGIVKLAGDFAKQDKSEFIGKEHVKMAIEQGKPVEEQIKKRYGSIFRASAADSGLSTKPSGRESEIA